MAVLQKIRNKGALLLVIIGFGLFAFIAEEFVRSIQTTANERRQICGEVCGKKIKTVEYQQMVETYKDALKFMRGNSSLNEYENVQADDNAWQMYVNYHLIANEAKKLGLTVTDDEMKTVLQEGTNQMLLQTPFVGPDKRFSAEALKNFLTEYEKIKAGNSEVPQQYVEQYESIFKYWKFVEESLRENLLQQKYQVLLASSLLTNPVEQKNFMEGEAKMGDLLVAALPFTMVKDSEVTVTDEEIKARYNETKEKYHQYIEARDIKYIAYEVTPSAKDKAEEDSLMSGFAEKLKTAEDVAAVVRKSNSLYSYNNIWVSKNAFSPDVQSKLETMSEGAVFGPYYEATDNTNNIIRMVAKTQAPDSVACKVIQVGGNTAEEAHQRADSIFAAIKAGAPFDSIAAKYGQKGAEQWIVSAQYESSPNLDETSVQLFNAVNTTAVNELKNISFDGGNIILMVTDRRNVITKYNVAVVKRESTFSKETYSKAYNDFSHFVSLYPKANDLFSNAASKGYRVETRANMMSNEHFVGNILDTKEALRWVFNDKTKVGDLSPLYECGDNNTLMIASLTGVHKQGYRSCEDVKEVIKAELIKEKKGAILAKKLEGTKNFATIEAMPGVLIDTIKNVNYNGVAFVEKTSSWEPKINGTFIGKKEGDVSKAIQGNGAVYVYQVVKTREDVEIYKNKRMLENGVRQLGMRNLNSFITDLYIKGDVKDNRYIFF